MAGNLGKIINILSKLGNVQQISPMQTYQNPQPAKNPQQLNDNATEANETSSAPAQKIYITMEDLNALFPGIADKLDVTKLLPSLTSKVGLSKLLESLGIVSISKGEAPNSKAQTTETPNTNSPSEQSSTDEPQAADASTNQTQTNQAPKDQQTEGQPEI